MEVRVWSDYLCPWCYLALDREELLAELGADVVVRPFDLHPEVPPGGRAIRGGGRTEAVFERIGAECRQLGLPFRMPARTPNTRLALAAAEHVRRTTPAAFPALHRSLFTAYFGEGRNIGNPSVVGELVRASGADPGTVRQALRDGTADGAVDASMAEAAEHGITATPAFVFDNGLLVPGVQPRETIERWVRKMMAAGG